MTSGAAHGHSRTCSRAVAVQIVGPRPIRLLLPLVELEKISMFWTQAFDQIRMLFRTLILLIVSFLKEIVLNLMKSSVSGFFFFFLTEFVMCCPLEEVSPYRRITKIFSHFFGKVYSPGFYI